MRSKSKPQSKSKDQQCPKCLGARVIETKPAGSGHSDDLAEYVPCDACCLNPQQIAAKYPKSLEVFTDEFGGHVRIKAKCKSPTPTSVRTVAGGSDSGKSGSACDVSLKASGSPRDTSVVGRKCRNCPTSVKNVNGVRGPAFCEQCSASESKSQYWTAEEVEAVEREAARLEALFGIATPRKRPSGPLSSPEPCLVPSEPADVVITRDSASHCWCIICGSHKSVIITDKGKHFNERNDPVMVAKYLASHAAGPINVIWW